MERVHAQPIGDASCFQLGCDDMAVEMWVVGEQRWVRATNDCKWGGDCLFCFCYWVPCLWISVGRRENVK